MMKRHFDLTFACLLFALPPALTHASNTLLAHRLDSLRGAETAVIDETPLLSGRLLADFYAEHENEVLWTDPKRIDALLQLVEESRAEGFDPEDFHASILRQLNQPGATDGRSEAERLALDITLSDALLRYVHHTRFGKLDPVAVDPKWNDRGPVPAEPLLADMRGALEAEDLNVYLSSRFEQPFWYEDLKRALGTYADMMELGDLDPIASGANLTRGSRVPRVALLRERLRLFGDHDGALPVDPDRFDEALSRAVISFQRRAGLSPDGIVGPATLAALNNPFDARKAEQIRINLERMRWFYNDLPPDYLFVDVANYQVRLVRDREAAWSTRVIVGSPDAQTPMFRDSMVHLVFNPTWTVPVSIQKKMGRVSARYTLVDRRTGRKSSGGDASNYRRYRVVQKPGPGNALGRVKFMFPNRHAVYLHDTSSRALFGRSRRALSHGCVRVQNPSRLAELLLDRPGWDRAKINRVMSGSRTRYVNLDEALPVLLYYLTAHADAHGSVSLRRDVYGRDQALREAFAAPVLSARIVFPEPPAPVLSEPVSEPRPALAPPIEPSPDAPSPEVPVRQDGVRLTQTGGSMP